MTQDITINCRDCGNDFVFTVREQEFFKQKGFENQPVRCIPCRKKKKARMERKEQRLP